MADRYQDRLFSTDAAPKAESDPLAELADSRLLLLRVLFGWIALIAIVVLGGWVG